MYADQVQVKNMDHSDETKVTVLCFAYNQSSYIKQCLKSLVSQITNFEFKIVVHDDASTDGTREIIEEFASTYPSLVKPIFQKINQYSQNTSLLHLVEPYLEGEYVAFCEGDDYWLDVYKLQKQFDYLESHPSCSLSAHGAELYHDPTQSVIGYARPSLQETDFSVEEIILGGGGFFATNSLFFRREFFKMPLAYLGWGVGDYPRCIYLATKGTVHFFPDIMSSYRMLALGSWSSKTKADKRLKINEHEQIIAGLEKADRITAFRFHNAFTKEINRRRLVVLKLRGDWAVIAQNKLYAECSKGEKVITWLDVKHPQIAELLRSFYLAFSRLFADSSR